jgi:hypothetical protein
MTRTKRTAVLAGALIVAGSMTFGLGTSARAATPRASKWRTTLVVGPASLSAAFTAVVTAGQTAAWAFATNYAMPSAPTAWELQGGHWTRRSFPTYSGESIDSASASSPSNVWAFTTRGRALRWNGTRWSGVASFLSIHDGLVLGANDVWVFGQPHGQPAGAWRYDGVRWHRYGPLVGFGSSTSPSGDSWVYGATSVWHWRSGTSWVATSLASLLPPSSDVCDSRITGILASSATSVWAVATGGCQDFRGPLVLLHFNGRVWTRLFVSQNLGAASAIASDGTGGVWMPVVTGTPGVTSMARYDGGVLTTVPLPYSGRRLILGAVATAPGSRTSFAAGSLRASSTYSESPVVLVATP